MLAQQHFLAFDLNSRQGLGHRQDRRRRHGGRVSRQRHQARPLGVTMVEMNRIRSMLEEKRRELADQLDAVDRALAAVNGAGTPVAEARPAEPSVSAVLPRSVKPRRVLSDAHKEAISKGKRRARAAKGLAREMPDDSFVPAIRTRGDDQSPRLVKRPIQK